MTDRERMAERIYAFADADKRARMTPEELSSCPTIEEIFEAMSHER